MFHGSYVYCVNLDFSTPIRFISPTLSFMNLFYPAVKSAGHFCYLAKQTNPKPNLLLLGQQQVLWKPYIQPPM